MSSAVLTALAALVLHKPRTTKATNAAFVATALVLLGIAAAYVLSRTSGLPFLITEPEDLDPVGAVTSAAEVLGGLASLLLITRKETA